MIRRPFRLDLLAATLLLPAFTGCTYLHKESPAPVPLIATAPTLAPPVSPLLSDLSSDYPPLPELPQPPAPSAQPTPPPASIVVDTARRRTRRRGRKEELELAHETRERENRETQTAEAATPPPPPTPAAASGQTVNVTAPTPKGDTSAPATSIGQLTAAAAPDSSGSRQQAADLIDSTERGVNSLHNIKGDQNKTVAQIRSFLDQAQRALHNGDVDGAHTLATKAKTLLDELTGAV